MLASSDPRPSRASTVLSDGRRQPGAELPTGPRVRSWLTSRPSPRTQRSTWCCRWPTPTSARRPLTNLEGRVQRQEGGAAPLPARRRADWASLAALAQRPACGARHADSLAAIRAAMADEHPPAMARRLLSAGGPAVAACADILSIDVIRSLVIIVALLTGMAYMTWFERRVISRLQVRIGPNRVGPIGLLQPLADALKLFFKEDIAPAHGRPAPVSAGAGYLAVRRAGGVRGDPDRSDAHDRRASSRAPDRQTCRSRCST